MKWLVAIVLIVAACGASTTAQPTAEPTPAPEALTFTGDTDLSTAPFALGGDTYISAWKKEPGCTLGVYLKSPADSVFSRDLGGSYSDGPTSGETWAYHVGGPGTFYLEVQGSCHWSLTLMSAPPSN